MARSKSTEQVAEVEETDAPEEQTEQVAEVEETDAPALGSPAERRADYLRALGEELAQCQAAGKDDRVKAIKAEISRVKKGPVGRQAPEADEA